MVVTRNAFVYCARLFFSLRRTRDVSYEVVVVDNRSRLATRALLMLLAAVGSINRLCLMDTNTLFAEGNNVGVDAGRRDVPYVLLLNSDVEVRDPSWLRRLIDGHNDGITTFGYIVDPPISRADGYCLLISRALYREIRLDEFHQWWWGVTKLQAAVLRRGLPVRSVVEHDDFLIHFGGKSGRAHRKAGGMDVGTEQVVEWFDSRQAEPVPTVAAL